MIINEITQIDHWVEELSRGPSNIISIDIKDYALIKNRSVSMKAVKYDTTELTEEILASIDDEFKELGKGKVNDLLLFFKCGRTTSFTIEEMVLLSDSIQRHIETENIIWGMSANNDDTTGLTIFVVAGYIEEE